jgi:hypothetical protein
MYPPIRLPPSRSRLIFARPSVPHGSATALAAVAVVGRFLPAASSRGAAATEPDNTPAVPATASDWFKKSRRLTGFDSDMVILFIE